MPRDTPGEHLSRLGTHRIVTTTESHLPQQDPPAPCLSEIQYLQEQLERQQALMQSLLGQIDVLMSANNEQELLDVVCTQLLATGLFLGAWVARTTPPPNDLQVLAAGGDGLALLAQLTPEQKAAWATRLDQVARTQEMLREDDLSTELVAPWQDVILPGFSTTILLIPIFRQRAPWTALVVVATHEGPLDRLLSDMLKRLGELLTSAFTQLDLRSRLIEEREQAAFLAHHDALTGLTNRRGIDEALPRAMARARRNNLNLAVVMLDLDDFKPINDRYGHAAGDALLQTLAQRIKATLRETDLAARLGGDEFLLLLEGIEQKKHLKKTLERIHNVLVQPVELPAGSSSVWASMGVALFPQDDCEPEQLVRHADAALYLSKNKKRTRKNSWCIWNDQTTDALGEAPGIEPHIPPYGVAAAGLLLGFAHQLSGLVSDFVDYFYAEITADPEAGRIIQLLSDEEFAHLKARQATHLHQLLDPDLTEATHRSTAKRVGEVHALVGLSASSLVRAMTTYLHQFDGLIAKHRLPPHEHARLELVLTERLSIELSEELESEHRVNNQYQQILLDIDALGRQLLSWQEFNERLLLKLSECPGIHSGWIGSPDAMGTFVINFSKGIASFTDAMLQHYGQVRMPKIAPGEPEMSGSTARAYRQAQTQTIASFSTAPEAEPWRVAALSVGVRSSAGIPIMDTQRRPIAILSLYGAFPNMFETPFRQSFCQQLGFIVSQTWQQFKQTQIVNTSIEELDQWRQAFYGKGLKLVYQPIVDLNSGRIEKVEALARLQLDDGRMVMPNAFIPRLNDQQIIQLFRMGLDQGLQQLVHWDQELPGSALGLALNLPLEALADNDCPTWIHDALHRHQIPATRLTLEMLEHHEMIDLNQSQRQMRTLSDLGVQLAMDDLGAGYSNLIRLNNLPFDTVKIDQALIRSAYTDPVRIIKFIGALVHMTHALDLTVVAEGLENPDLMEAARILGADMAQGYTIARPLPPEEFTQFYRQRIDTSELGHPHTALGAIATHWRMINALIPVSHAPDLGQVSRCPVHQFIAEQGLLGSELDAAHCALHDSEHRHGRHSSAFQHQLQQVQALLAKLVPAPKTLQ